MCVCMYIMYICRYVNMLVYKLMFQHRRKKSVMISSFQRMSITVHNELHDSMCTILFISKGI